ncbi:hypothetical protein ACHQM5_027676 [Ranunculus cassubicifolius]
MWRRVITLSSKGCNHLHRRFSTETHPHRLIEDEGDWFYSSEWWNTSSESRTVLSSTSEKGNGIISVISHPCSKPEATQWPKMERWLQQRYAEICPENAHNDRFRVLGYQWRVLRFNDFTRQSAVKIMAACRTSDPSSVCIMQQPHILAVPYLKSMVSVGLSALVSCDYELKNAANAQKPMHILCIGHGGGSLPLFLASKIQGAVVDVVEIDPHVISVSTRAMGFPSFARVKPSGERELSHPRTLDEVLWKGTHERLSLYEADASDFILTTSNIYDLVFIDAYDGDDIFPHKLWDPNGSFLQTLKTRVHPKHGTVVVNLHADSDISDSDEATAINSKEVLPMGKYVSRVCKAYRDTLVGNGSGRGLGLGLIAEVPWLCNSSVVVSRGFDAGGSRVVNRDFVLERLLEKSRDVEDCLKMPFSCLEYIKKIAVLGG